MTPFEMLKQALRELERGDTRRKVGEFKDQMVYISCNHGVEDGMFWVMFKPDGTYEVKIPEDAS